MFTHKNKQFNSLILLVIFILTCFLSLAKPVSAQTNDYPKVANYYLAWVLDDKKIDQLAQWDLLILSPQVLELNPNALKKLRQKNPHIKILVYVPSEDINVMQDVLKNTPVWSEIYNTVNQNDWWLRTANRDYVVFWPGTRIINASSAAPKTNGQNWSQYLPNLVNKKFLQSGEWDGVFYDSVWYDIDWVNKNIDVNADNQADSKDYMNKKWQEGIKNIIETTRSLAPDKIIICNANSNFYNPQLNGRMQENFPASYEGGWTGTTKNYLYDNLGYAPNFFIINGYNSTTKSDNYRSFRYGLTSTLLGDGYYSFDNGDEHHDAIYWYDEYNLFLGKAMSEPKNLLDSSNATIQPGVWQRNFQNGISLVNSTDSEQKIKFAEEFEKIKGTQDPLINNGAIIKSVTLAPQDGVILLRRVEDIIDSPYYNGSFVRVFNKYGEATRNGFFVYEKQYKGGQMIEKTDINHDGQIEIIVSDNSKITIYTSDNTVITSFYPYGEKYNYGLNFSIADFDNDGYKEIITGTQKGYGPLVKVFNYLGQPQGEGFYAYAQGYKGGVNVAVCDTNGNGKKEIVTGSGYMGGPQVRIFDKNGKILSGGFFAYNKTFRGGVNVACGDIDGNGIDEIVTGAGYGGSSHVRYFNSKFEPLSPGFFAFGTDSRTGVRVITNDLNNDGAAEILAASPDVFTTAFDN